MAGNKINTKSKGREEKNKSKSVNNTNEENDEPDFSSLRKPIPTSITSFARARYIFDTGTEELKSLMTNECDLLYECKVCRSIFRSLMNYVSHKRIYCQENFSPSTHGHFSETVHELSKIKFMESKLQASKSQEIDGMGIDDIRIPLSKDLTSVIERITQNRGTSKYLLHNPEVTLKKIPSSTVAMFQNINFDNKDDTNHIGDQVQEINNILSKDGAVLQSDGKFEIASSKGSETDNVIQISDDEDKDDLKGLKCKICNLQFSTQKTLKFHMKYKHLESRLVYPCPDCFETFCTSWSVYRHLFKVHRKTAAQIRRLRETIQAKAFKMNNPPASYEKKKNMKSNAVLKITEEERLEQENQAWMDNMEGDGEVPRCGGCGRTFERRAALAAHTHTCQPRCRALARKQQPHEGKKIEIQIRKDYNKGPTPGATANKIQDEHKISDKSLIESAKPVKKEKPTENEKQIEDISMDVAESDDGNKNTKEVEQNVNISNYKPTIHLPYAQQSEKHNFQALKQRMQNDVDFDKLLCKKCDFTKSTPQELFDHMAEHYKWVRYGCKLCTFRHYSFEKLPCHVKIVHRLKGDTDFYFSTVKAIDGIEALELSPMPEETNDSNENSPVSRRPSRCSSDSSRLSDDSCCSSTRVETGRKRKRLPNKINPKKMKDSNTNDESEEQKESDLSNTGILNESNVKQFEENSSDFDERINKRNLSDVISVTSKRPVRKRTKPKNEDFEYDLSNLLKKETQGYKDSQGPVPIKNIQNKKKNQLDSFSSYDIANKDCCGALAILSKKSLAVSAAHIKMNNFINVNELQVEKERSLNIFAKPMLPKATTKADKISPKKEPLGDIKEPNTQIPNSKPWRVQDIPLETKDIATEADPAPGSSKTVADDVNADQILKSCENNKNTFLENHGKSFKNGLDESVSESVANKPAMLPIKLRRQSLEVIKNPIVNKNLSNLTKSGMKTKILVIKPINRNSQEGSKSVSAPIKFQTIKLKDPNKQSSPTEDLLSDQVVVVKVPKVESVIAKKVPDSVIAIEKSENDENTLSPANYCGTESIADVCESNSTSGNEETKNHVEESTSHLDNTINDLDSSSVK